MTGPVVGDIEVVEVPDGTVVELAYEPGDPLEGAAITGVVTDQPPWSGGGGPPTGGAGGVLSGQYPNPGFAQDMTYQSEHNAHVDSATPHPSYDDMPSLTLLFQNGLT